MTLVGLPGVPERITVVPRFAEGPQQADNPAGGPGKYEVTLLFARPFTPLPTDSIRMEPDVEGDSLVQWFTVAPPGSSDFHLKIAALVESRAIEYHLRPNSRGFLARADACFDASNFQEAEDFAYRGLAPMLSHWSTALDLPIQVGRVFLREIATEARRTNLLLGFPEVKFSPPASSQLGPEYRMYASLYREGLASTSHAYQFLCFYKILEGIRARRTRIDRENTEAGEKPKRGPERLPASHVEVPAWLDSLFIAPRPWDEFSVNAIVPKEALGKKVTAVQETLRPIRNEIAHTLTDEREPNSAADEHFDSPEIVKWLPLLRCIARLMMSNEFPSEFLRR